MVGGGGQNTPPSGAAEGVTVVVGGGGLVPAHGGVVRQGEGSRIVFPGFSQPQLPPVSRSRSQEQVGSAGRYVNNDLDFLVVGRGGGSSLLNQLRNRENRSNR